MFVVHLSQTLSNVEVRKGTLQYLQSAHSGDRVFFDIIFIMGSSKRDISLFNTLY
jgi:hypothetical protein